MSISTGRKNIVANVVTNTGPRSPKVELGETPDGRAFPMHEGKLLSWDIGSHNSHNEQQAGYPKMRTVIRAKLQHGRGDEVEGERRDMLRSAMGDRMFGHNARKVLDVIEDEVSKHNAKNS